ncbi:hypothetical protein PN437_20060, partial [Microcystis aeruginosa CS-564/01]|uniref:hypothetical protein n=1 Tax=Microcystis aeruginosa TaxID=1126 RepID=UPI0023309083
ITGGNLYWSYSFRIIEFIGVLTVQSIHPGHFDLSQSAYNKILVFDYKIKDLNTNQYPPLEQCVFKVFGVFNQEILSITRDVCPEVIVVPERCYFRPENERLVGRWIVGFWDPPLRIEYEGHCASVWRDYGLFSLLIFKECSDNPSCPPPRIRFDKKCEEKCEQCPPGTAIKVLLGGNIACVDSVGCVKKMIKYKPGCNSYDCICS